MAPNGTGGVSTCSQISDSLVADTLAAHGPARQPREQQQQQQLSSIEPLGAISERNSGANPEGEHKKCSISSSSSSMLTNSIASPSSSLTSILASSPTSTTELCSAATTAAAAVVTVAARAQQAQTELGLLTNAADAASKAELCDIGVAQAAVDDDDVSRRSQHLIMMTNVEQRECSPAYEELLAAAAAPLSHPVVAQREDAQPIVAELLGGPSNGLPVRPQQPDHAREQLLERTDTTTTVDLLATNVVVVGAHSVELPPQDAFESTLSAARLAAHQDLLEDQSHGLLNAYGCSRDATPAASRLERSNSCSQAECGQLAATSLASIAQLHPPTTSVSHENLASASSSLIDGIQDGAAYAHVAAVDSGVVDLDEPPASSRRNQSQPIDIVGGHRDAVSSSAASSPSSNRDEGQQQYSSSYKEKSSFLQSKAQQQQQQLPPLQQQQEQQQLQQQQQHHPTKHSQQPSVASSFASTSRFFSSKLNTGSLWSLLSAGSSSSSIMNDQSLEGPNQSSFADLSNNQQHQQAPTRQQSSAANNMQEMAALVASKSSSFLNRYQNQFKLSKQQSSGASTTSADQPSNSSSGAHLPLQQRSGSGEQQLDRRRYRFNVKYIGSALLHRNFTLPMLEWIAKDIRRQTIRGAQSITQRQFTIPSREIILELQLNQLTAISCKDSHCLFVHPMHCVSKYVQLQHDATCFAYIIRDNKDSPSFCHVFQAKSTSKIHEIFSAIREVATRSQIQTNQENGTPANRLQKSASTDGHWRSLLTQPAGDLATLSAGASGLKSPPGVASRAPPSPPPLPPPTATAALYLHQQQLAQQQQVAQSLQFDNSYQFEVMFVKRVKLQCRRVPPSFVDDALETLKSFEVLKGNHHLIGDHSKSAQIKGSLVSKRIINASVDERQEYDESCQSPTAAQPSTKVTRDTGAKPYQPDEKRINGDDAKEATPESIRRKHSTSIDCLKSLDTASKSSQEQQQQHPPPAYANDFSPYNTITSSDLNERIAAIPVVSGGSVSLDHETRQKLARQVRETIQATAANIKRGVYASGDKLDSSTSSKALDSLSCNVISSMPSVESVETTATALAQPANEDGAGNEAQQPNAEPHKQQPTDGQELGVEGQRRASACATGLHKQQHQQLAGNNFDLFRRASARQVVKNRTMLLLIGKDELCAISIDKHQMLFSKSFNSIVHCLQGNNNRDHFGLICRDSGKINPNTETYAGYVFRCQSDKVVREIMGALKQVIYSSQHNYHGYNSPYNPLNLVASRQAFVPATKTATPSTTTSGSIVQQQASNAAETSLAAKRGFAANPLELEHAAKLPVSTAATTATTLSTASSPLVVASQLCGRAPPTAPPMVNQPQFIPPAKNLIKSMFCDNCPLYWYHRLCCDVESLPAEASKAIILRRIDSSLSEKEQDEVYSRFSEFNIDSIDEHNEIFMSILRQQCERKQTKHSQTQAHLSAMAKNASLARQISSSSMESNRSLSATREATAGENSGRPFAHHQRSDSSGGSLIHLIGGGGGGGQTPTAQQQSSLADAGSLAIDNLKRAKNSISVSIENMLKRRSSIKDEQEAECQTRLTKQLAGAGHLPTRAGSFKSPQGRESRSNAGEQPDASCNLSASNGSLKRSQSTSDSSSGGSSATTQRLAASSWRDSLSRTINESATDLGSNSLVGFFRHRNSIGRDNQQQQQQQQQQQLAHSLRATVSTGASRENICADSKPAQQLEASSVRDSRRQSPSRLAVHATPGGTSSPSSMLSGVFWKKSLFDKIRQPVNSATAESQATGAAVQDAQSAAAPATVATDSNQQPARTRTRDELRSLWRKAIFEQITLLKMDRQNQKLLARASSARSNTMQPCPLDECCNIQHIKLNYRDVAFGKEAPKLWGRLLQQDPTRKVDFMEVARLVRLGVPKARRGEVWMFLMNQYQLRHGTSFQPADRDYHGDANQTYRSLLTQLSTQQHEIFVDIGRTFPSHPYYSQYLSIGQLSLFNLLKAYSLLDREVGYCQGLSFVAGILLLHVDSEDEAFELMRHLLFNFGLRKQYLPSMNALHLQLYQMTRLLRDHEYDLFAHFDHQDISPSLYAAPWFLTLFASQFPLGFVARLLDLIFLIGIEAIFRISLKLLTYHRNSILECTCLETTMEFMRTEFIKINDKDLAELFDKSMSMDLRNKLIEYEIEYSFYCAEDKARMVNNAIKSTHLGRPAAATASGQNQEGENDAEPAKSSDVADATATVIIQHLLANNHLRSLKTDYSY